MTSNEEYIRKNKIEVVDNDKNTKLHYAAALGNAEELEKAIANGQKLDPENYLGWTPLMMAVKNGNRNTTDILLTKGANATMKNKFGMNVFLISVTSGDLDIVAKILNHLLCGGVSRQSIERELSPIALAILFGHSNIFRYLLERSFDPNAATLLTGITPAMFAAAIGNNKAIKRLLHYNADITLKNYLGKTASEILQSRVDVDTGGVKQKPQHLPLIIISPHNQTSPHFQLTPYPKTAIPISSETRKSSNTRTPNMICTPTISPITPVTSQFIPHMFFGPDFTPSHYFLNPSPQYAFPSHNILNATINSSAAFVSPIPPQPVLF